MNTLSTKEKERIRKQGLRLKKARKEMRMSQEKLKNLLGFNLTRTAIQNWEAGRNDISEKYIDVICEILDLGKNYLKYGHTIIISTGHQDAENYLKELDLEDFEYNIIIEESEEPLFIVRDKDENNLDECEDNFDLIKDDLKVSKVKSKLKQAIKCLENNPSHYLPLFTSFLISFDGFKKLENK